MESKERWQDWAALGLGAWLLVAPFVLGFHASLETAAWSETAVGVLLVASAIWALAAGSSSLGAPVHHH